MYVEYLNLNGFFVVADRVQEQANQLVFYAYQVFGWDALQQEYTIRFFDFYSGSQGAEPLKGAWGNDTLTLYQAAHPGYTRYSYHFNSEEYQPHHTLQLDFSTDGDRWEPLLEGEFRQI